MPEDERQYKLFDDSPEEPVTEQKENRPPEAGEAKEKPVEYETVSCQYCQDVGICMYCSRGKQQSAEMIQLRNRRRK